MPRVRTASLSDFEAIQSVCVRNGLSSFNPDMMRKWWTDHPFRKEFDAVPIGWVLESDANEIVGVLLNIPVMYELNGKRLKCGIGSRWAVDPQYRNSSVSLMTRYLGQKEIDFCIDGSASPTAGRVLTALKFSRIPSTDFDVSQFWIVRPRAFAASVLRKKKVWCPNILSIPASLVLHGRNLLCGRTTVRGQVQRESRFGGEFDRLWNEIRKSPGKLRAVRTSAALEWRFGDILRNKRGTVLSVREAKELKGYAVLVEKERQALGMRQYVLADLQARSDSPEVFEQLLAASIEITRRDGLDVLEWSGWNVAKRQIAIRLRPISYRYSAWPAYYRARNPEIETVLGLANTWDFSPFDIY